MTYYLLYAIVTGGKVADQIATVIVQEGFINQEIVGGAE